MDLEIDIMDLEIDMLPFTAAVLGIMYIILSFQVIQARIKEQVVVGCNDSEHLLRAIRVQGNFAEFTPIFLILFFLVDYREAAHDWVMNIIGPIFIIGRIMHAYSMKVAELKGGNIIFRQLAIGSNFLCIAVLSIYLLFDSFYDWLL